MTPGEVAALDAYGRKVGVAFQMLDDLLDVSGPAERTGKHRGTDLLDGTVTLPLILARESDPALAESTCARSKATSRPRRSATGSPRPVRSSARESARGRWSRRPRRSSPEGRAGSGAAAATVADRVVERYS